MTRGHRAVEGALVVGVLLSVASADLNAQGRLRGEVTDEWGNGLEGVQVIVSNDRSSRETTTDDDGDFFFNGLPGGEFTIEFQAEGYRGARSPITISGLNRPFEIELGVLPFGSRFREETRFEAEGGTPRIAFDAEGTFEFEDANGEGKGTYGINALSAVLVVRDYDGPDDAYSITEPVVVTFANGQFTSLTWGGATLTNQSWILSR